MVATMRVEGLAEANKRLQAFPGKIQKRVIRKAVNAGAQPMLQAVRANTPRRTGITRRGMAVKLKAYRQAMVAIVGQDKRARPKALKGAGSIRGGISGRGYPVPIHLLDQPTKPHRIGSRLLRWVSGSTLLYARSVQHPGTRGQEIMSRAFASSRSAAELAVTAKLTAEVEREAGGT